MKFNNYDGFTLLEVLIVISLLGVILVLTIPNIASGSEHAHKELCKSSIILLEGAIAQYETVKNSTIDDKGDIANYLYKNNFLEYELECPLGGTYKLSKGKVSCNH
ncbi:prepilin-type N-terminal cleavage/methylation domain-containing protein [Proteinivorax tanatarense]|uniref:Prepilin-type N-terminal cleavage/methylation domain-containing protein n=1 Tax=Proteinivorax tanatarense TaxID=1260629 RepID=A0AAU7VNE8_9FIRM